jgi:hypothetical protein
MRQFWCTPCSPAGQIKNATLLSFFALADHLAEHYTSRATPWRIFVRLIQLNNKDSGVFANRASTYARHWGDTRQRLIYRQSKLQEARNLPRGAMDFVSSTIVNRVTDFPSIT